MRKHSLARVVIGPLEGEGFLLVLIGIIELIRVFGGDFDGCRDDDLGVGLKGETVL